MKNSKKKEPSMFNYDKIEEQAKLHGKVGAKLDLERFKHDCVTEHICNEFCGKKE